MTDRRFASLAALLALAACASEPPIATLMEDPRPVEEAEPADLVEPWDNPIKATAGAPIPRRSQREILASALGEAATGVDEGNWKGAKLRYRWVDGKSYDVALAKDRITTLMLFPGEGFVNYSYGDEYFGPELKPTWSGTRDAAAMRYGPAQTAVPITPWVTGKCTDLTVYTTWRTILMDVCATGTKKAYNRLVEWWMPGEELRRFSEALAAGAASGPAAEPATGVPHAEIKARYRPVQAADGWRADEWSAYHDGRKTYVVPPPDLGFDPVPAVRVAGDGATPLFRSRPRADREGSYFQIDARPEEVVMVHGSDTLVLRRGAP